MIIHTFSNGDEVHKYQKTVVLTFAGARKVLSTAPNNGGLRGDLRAVFNNDCKPGEGMACELKAPTYEGHIAIISEELGLGQDVCAGMVTAASMDNLSIKTESYKELCVTAIVTGGIEINGSRVGDPAFWHEEKENFVPVKPGTINIILHINANLTPGALTRSLVTCTEAKTAAIGELMASSRYSMGIATGSGTDGTIIVSDSESDMILTQAGKHSKLGELIGITVMSAVKEALDKQSGLNPMKQHDALRRVDRFGITEDTLWSKYQEQPGNLDKPHFLHRLQSLAKEDMLLTYTSLYVHLIDQMQWGLISPNEAYEAGMALLNIISNHTYTEETLSESDTDNIIEKMVQAYEDCMIQLVKS